MTLAVKVIIGILILVGGCVAAALLGAEPDL